MEQIERIRHMEDILRRGETVCRALEAALDSYEAILGEAEELGAYYGSDAWFFDLDCDRAGLLPAGLRRGVLSEDEAYDFLTELHTLRERMQALSGPDEKE